MTDAIVRLEVAQRDKRYGLIQGIGVSVDNFNSYGWMELWVRIKSSSRE